MFVRLYVNVQYGSGTVVVVVAAVVAVAVVAVAAKLILNQVTRI